jgi:E3 ubiquitin-protein ligase MARCH6
MYVTVLPYCNASKSTPQINRNGWTRPDPIMATKEVIAPTIAGLLGMLLLPPAVLWICARIWPIQITDRTLCELTLLLIST